MTKSLLISYSSKDARFVSRLSKDLRNLGVDVWFDKFNIKVGDSIPGKIAEGLSMCDSFLIVLSPNAVSSKWVFSELETALNEHYSGRLNKVYPILLEECERPIIIRKLKYADCSREYEIGFSELIDALGIPRVSHAPNDPSLEAMLRMQTKMWFSTDFSEQSRGEWTFIEAHREHRESSEVFSQVLNDYLNELLIYRKDIYTEDRIRVAARVIDTCEFIDSNLAPVLIQLLTQLAEHGTHRKPIDDLVRGLRMCWDEKYRAFLNHVLADYPKVNPIRIA